MGVPSCDWHSSQLTQLSLDEELTFIHPDDADLYNAWDSRAFDVQVAIHELLGHGSGKLFQEEADGKRNFDPEKVRYLLCGVPFLIITDKTEIRSSIRSQENRCGYPMRRI